MAAGDGIGAAGGAAFARPFSRCSNRPMPASTPSFARFATASPAGLVAGIVGGDGADKWRRRRIRNAISACTICSLAMTSCRDLRKALAQLLGDDRALLATDGKRCGAAHRQGRRQRADRAEIDPVAWLVRAAPRTPETLRRGGDDPAGAAVARTLP